MTPQPLNRPCGVDVLRWIRNTPAENGWKAKERDAVANAVAELIEAAGEIISHTRGCEILLQVDEQPTTQRLRAALAAIGSRP